MNWTTTSTTVVIGALLVVFLLVGLILWKTGVDKDCVVGWFAVAGVFLLGTVIVLVCICQAQTDQIRASQCRKDIAPAVIQAHPEWSAEEVKAILSKVCP